MKLFNNISPTDFSIASEREKFQKAIDTLNLKISKSSFEVHPIINGSEESVEKSISRENPNDTSEKICQVHLSGTKELEKSIEKLKQGFLSWKNVNLSNRANTLRKVADIMNKKRFELSAIMTKESGKPWKEADADVVEAIDFCNYYAYLAEITLDPINTQIKKAELNELVYIPRGLVAVISPWNFPLAIPCGMVVAALVSGNSVIFKPAEQSSLIAKEFVSILLEAGIPENVISFLPGLGSEIGNAIVKHPSIDMITFTGSKEVGLDIIYESSVVRPNQRNIKKVIAEMGGKNCIIVDEGADIDEAVKGILYSAFGFSGQKCSACSRVIGVGDIYERLVDRLTSAASDLIVGRAENSASFLGPVIDKDSFERLNKFIENCNKEYEIGYSTIAPLGGYFIGPHIYKNVPANSKLWQEELFGPILASLKCNSFAEAIDVANDSPYALTGGIYSRSPKSIKYARANLEVGNLYINRPCTGAIVQRQPFGGYKLSGIGEKAGGPNYLKQFVYERAISENTTRKGFVPGLAD